jgi:Acetyltransferases, including N-acetylases of ribosomal proteins
MSKYYKKLIGKKVYLSPRSTEDAGIFMNWINDFQVTDGTLTSDRYHTIESEREYLENSAKKSDKMNFSIIDITTDKPVGNCSIMDIDKTHSSAELGIMIGEKASRGQGIGQEVLGLLLDYCFNYLNLHSIYLHALEDNITAVKCYEKVGFKQQGVYRESAYINGKYRNTVLMDILRSEFGDRQHITNKFIK